MEIDWLASLAFREGAFPKLAAAAEQGDPTAFSTALLRAYDHQCRLGKRERSRMLATLERLWSQTALPSAALRDEGSLARCLFNQDLSGEELTGRLEAIMASDIDDTFDSSTLAAAFWMLRLRGGQLELQTLFTCLRWVVLRTHDWLEQRARKHAESTDPGAGCQAFDGLELQLLLHGGLPGRKGEKKEWRDIANAWRTALDAATDTDGTPHSEWVPESLSRCCQLAAVSLFADSLNLPLWSKKDRKRLQGLCGRTALLLSPDRMSFHEVSATAAAEALTAAAEALRLEDQSGFLALLKQWRRAPARSRRSASTQPIRGKFPRANVQSDWGEWACLRSAWNGPVDQCVIRYDEMAPQLEMLAAGQPLFAGAWEHSLTVDGQPVASTGEWACCCWYVDRHAAFMELQLNRDQPVQVIRQALLLREESVLMVADSIRLPAAGKMEFQRRLPLAGGWRLEEDTLSREVALCQDDRRIRVFPWSSPQMRLDRSDETLILTPEEMTVETSMTGTGLYVATLFDWSEKRRDAPVDWRRVTVAEDGRIMLPEVAVGHRLRLGKKQWVLYHSHRPPAFPRSVLGIHTLSETVFARLSPHGEADPLVEVEL